MGRPLIDDAQLPVKISFGTAVPVAVVVKIRQLARSHGTTVSALTTSALTREVERIEAGGEVP